MGTHHGRSRAHLGRPGLPHRPDRTRRPPRTRGRRARPRTPRRPPGAGSSASASSDDGLSRPRRASRSATDSPVAGSGRTLTISSSRTVSALPSTTGPSGARSKSGCVGPASVGSNSMISATPSRPCSLTRVRNSARSRRPSGTRASTRRSGCTRTSCRSGHGRRPAGSTRPSVAGSPWSLTPDNCGQNCGQTTLGDASGGRFTLGFRLLGRLVAEDRVVPGLLGLAGQLDHHVLDLGVLVERVARHVLAEA